MPLPFPIDTPPTDFNIDCLDILPTIPPEIEASGIIVLVEQSPRRDAYLLNIKTGSTILLPRLANESTAMFSVSPNRQWLAYYAEGTQLDNSRLIVVDSSGGQVITKTVSKFEWWGIDGWLNNQEILIDKYQSLPNISLATPLPALVFNPFTGFENDLAGNYPNMVYLYPKFEWKDFGFSAAGYDPTLNLVAYARKDGYVILWDIQASREISKLRGSASFGNGPSWLPDGSQFIIDSPAEGTSPEETWNEEIYSVSRSGKISRLTYLTNEFLDVSISGYEWSPDGNMIAFWLATKPDIVTDPPSQNSLIDRLTVLDTKTQLVTSYCLGGESIISTPVWSPDGNQILINVRDGNSFSSVFVDIEHKIAAWVARNAIPVGWMIETP
jgi:WD40 repeat protein